MNKTRPAFLPLTLAFACPMVAHAAVQLSAHSDVTISLHQPVSVALVLRNAGSQPDTVVIGQSAEWKFRVTVTRPDGTKVPPLLPLWARAGGEIVSGIETATLQPSESYLRTVLLDEWGPFDQLGTYRVTFELPDSVGLADFQVTVTPRNAEVLAETCEHLLLQVHDIRSAERLAALRALSFINDEIAVPYLTRAFFAEPESSDVVRRLLFLDQSRAAAAFQTLLRQGPAATRELARRHLKSLLESTRSETLRQSIRTSLAEPAAAIPN
jgi:hypothetical protein